MNNQTSARASAYIYKNKLFVVGVSESNAGVGPVPFNVAVPLDSEETEGPVNLQQTTPGIERALRAARGKIQEDIGRGEIEAAAEQLVIRARAGDQNASALIMATRQRAIQGVTRAINTCNAIKNYIKKNPVGGKKKSNSFGIETAISRAKNPVERNAAIVAYGPSLPAHYLMVSLANSKVDLPGVFNALEDNCRPSFKMGYNLSGEPMLFSKSIESLNKEDFDSAKLGFLFGRAQRIKAVRQGKPVSLLSKVAGWELGE